MIVPGPNLEPARDQVLPGTVQMSGAGVIPAGMHSVNADGANWSGPTYRRSTGREYMGIVGEDGNIYWIEIERTRTLERGLNPLPQGGQFNEM